MRQNQRIIQRDARVPPLVNTRRTLTPTSSSAHPVDIVRIFRMAEEPAPALVATPHEAQKTILDQTLRSKKKGVNIARDFTVGPPHDRRERMRGGQIRRNRAAPFLLRSAIARLARGELPAPSQ